MHLFRLPSLWRWRSVRLDHLEYSGMSFEWTHAKDIHTFSRSKPEITYVNGGSSSRNVFLSHSQHFSDVAKNIHFRSFYSLTSSPTCFEPLCVSVLRDVGCRLRSEKTRLFVASQSHVTASHRLLLIRVRAIYRCELCLQPIKSYCFSRSSLKED